jgi:hypothetical protein
MKEVGIAKKTLLTTAVGCAECIKLINVYLKITVIQWTHFSGNIKL